MLLAQAWGLFSESIMIFSESIIVPALSIKAEIYVINANTMYVLLQKELGENKTSSLGSPDSYLQIYTISCKFNELKTTIVNWKSELHVFAISYI